MQAQSQHTASDNSAMLPSKSRLPKLTLAALGVVYGDIGTSPLYALNQCFLGNSGINIATENILGILSLIFWTLIILISIKYLTIIMRANNNGSGGILALLALIDPWKTENKKLSYIIIILGLFGAALILGDGMLTPAISVISAIEGLKDASPGLDHLIVPLTLIILVLLYSFQKQGSEVIGTWFGPVMIVWFIIIGFMGITQIQANPQILAAINPFWAFKFFIDQPTIAFIALGGVFLAATGGEALYADMGHFGLRPIRIAWFGLVLPALVLNYFGQGAFLLQHPNQSTHMFYNLVPHWAIYPMIGLSAIVTVIASQAIISGTFSLVRQAVQLHHSPAVRIIQTSSHEAGQIYIPSMNWFLFIGTAALVIGFGSSTNLASAYGVAISGTMVITTFLAFFVMRNKWNWSLPAALGLVTLFMIPDLSFFSANLLKVMDGGWFPIGVGVLACIFMTTWGRGRKLFYRETDARLMQLEELINNVENNHLPRIEGTAVFLTPPGNIVPSGLLHNLKINKVLHEQVIFATSLTKDIPYVDDAQRVDVTSLGGGFYRLFIYYGFMESPNLPVAIKMCADRKLIPNVDPEWTAYFADRATLLLSSDTKNMSMWRKKLFDFMLRNSQRAVDYYQLPPGSSVELGLLLVL